MNTKKKTVSVAIATFNGELYIAKQIESIVKQSVLPDEVIVSDDRSTDKTLQIIEDIKPTLPFDLKIFKNQKQLGYSQNFNNALKNCSCDIVFICDQDDYWLENKIEVILDSFQTYPNMNLIIHDLEFCDSHLNKTNIRKSSRFKGRINLMHGYVTGMATAIRSEFLKKCMPIPMDISVEYDTWLHHLALYTNSKFYCPTPLALYRRHESNATQGSSLNNPHSTFFTDKLRSLNPIDSFERILKRDLITMEKLKSFNSSIDTDINHLNNRIEASIARIDILKSSFLKRPVLILKALLKGKYLYFSGIKSAIKDLIN